MDMPRAIFWDMDGTLVDSEPLWERAIYELSERLGRRLTPELRRETVGGSFPQALRICARHAGVEIGPGQAAALRREMFARMGALLRAGLRPREGVTELLTDLRAAGVPMYVTTNTERPLAEPAIEAVGRGFFAGSVTGDEVARYKPAPDMYLRAAELAGVDPADCLVFEDSANGMRGAVSAGCRVVGLSDGEQEIPSGVLPMPEVHGSCSFAGVDAATVARWHARCPAPPAAAGGRGVE